MPDTDTPRRPGPQRVFVAGASGYIGRTVVGELVARGHEVTAYLRPAAAADRQVTDCLRGATIRQGEMADAASIYRDGFAGAAFDAVVSCIASRTGSGTDAWQVDYAANRRLLDATHIAAARRFVLLSAICVQRPVLAFQRAKLAFEAELQRADLNWSIVRPTAYFKSLAGQVARVKAGKPFLLFGCRGDGAGCLPISERDVASFMADCLIDDALSDRILPIGGPGPAITPRERGQLLFALAGKRPRYRRIPLTLFKGLIPALDLGGRLHPKLANAAEFARIARFYATEPMLVRDRDGRYRAGATPRYGADTLDAFYRRVWREGLSGQELGEQALF